MKKIVIMTTNHYPRYNREEIEVNDNEAMERFDAISKELIMKCNKGELQDYQLELRDR